MFEIGSIGMEETRAAVAKQTANIEAKHDFVMFKMGPFWGIYRKIATSIYVAIEKCLLRLAILRLFKF